MTLSPGESRDRLESATATERDAARPLDVEYVRGLYDSKSSFTIGLEDELMLLDPSTLELVPSSAFALEGMSGDARFKRELREAQLEIVTPVSGNAVAAALHVAQARLELDERLRGDVLVAASGTHPFSASWGEIAEAERYRQLAQEFARAAHGQLPSALHVHVAVPGADRALAVYNAARSFLPEIGALAANSPFLDGRDTGLASVRSELMIAPHRSGTPPSFAGWDAFVDLVEWARRGDLYPDASHLWWDLRPHARFGTLEFRVADAQTRVEDTAAVAAVIQTLVTWLAGRFDAEELLPVHDTGRIAENAWRAARYGTRGSMVDLETGEPEETRHRISRLLTALEPSAERLGVSWALLTARALLADNGAERQRYVAARRGMRGLVTWLAEQTVASASEYLGHPRRAMSGSRAHREGPEKGPSR